MVRQGGRRPPSQKTVKAQSSQLDDALVGFMSDMPSSSKQTYSKEADSLVLSGTRTQPDAVDDLFTASSTVLPPASSSPSTAKKSKKPVARPAAKKESKYITKDILFGNDDLLAESSPKETATVMDQKRVTEIEKQIQKEIHEDDDLFGTKVLNKNLTSTISDDLFGNPNPGKPAATAAATTSETNKSSSPTLKVNE